MAHEVKSRGLEGKITKVIGFDARGFIYGPLIAQAIDAGFVMLRKKGKLPGETVDVTYSTEYSEDCLQLISGVVEPHDRVLLVDDLVATGGTLDAGVRIIDGMAKVEAALCLFKVDFFWKSATEKLAPYTLISVI